MAGEDRADRRRAVLKAVLEIPVILVVSFALVFGFVRPVIAAPFYVGSGSMEPTLHGCWGCSNDRLLINKLAYDLADPERGDIVLFEDQRGGEDPLIKRVIGLPGEELELRNGRVYVNGTPLDEPYLRRDTCKPGYPKTCSFGPVTVPKNHYFMMGDNRTRSVDSRFFGPVPKDDIIGEALVRFWPPNRAGEPG
ncbi:MAG: Signal peptidase I [uncultured Rubrobacteraceae bacterium]|uniref:Signal peptidase I n=1 Tax=uncultured Rubrobacteraceae bacterium TaxID=349277 RepID=A0A6J4NZ35_9ACTN|nr:MAG: Signal peptidase I [uncultured Rubrobacteraceae bacterium]